MNRWLLALALVLPGLASATTPTALTAAGVHELLQPPARGERLIALWALDCVYCESNLQALARLQQAHPHDVQLVLVATDSMAFAPRIAKRLHAAGVEHYRSLAYADASPERIDYLLDPDWGGETPRVLVIRADGTHRGYSGALTPAILGKLRP